MFTFDNAMSKMHIAKFEKISKEEWDKSIQELKNTQNKHASLYDIVSYDDIQLPKRSTASSAGYDFFLPCSIHIDGCFYNECSDYGVTKKCINVNPTILIPTGIKCQIDPIWALFLYPRSSMGFKYGIQLANTVGVVDADYYNNPTNEGHIFIKLKNGNNDSVNFNAGDKFAQGIFMQYGTAIGDNVTATRTGGLGSTGA